MCEDHAVKSDYGVQTRGGGRKRGAHNNRSVIIATRCSQAQKLCWPSSSPTGFTIRETLSLDQNNVVACTSETEAQTQKKAESKFSPFPFLSGRRLLSFIRVFLLTAAMRCNAAAGSLIKHLSGSRVITSIDQKERRI